MHPLVLFVSLAAVSQAHGQRCVENVQEIGAVRVDQKEPLDYEAAISACDKLGRSDLLTRFDKLTEEEKALCGDQLVPYMVSEEPPPLDSKPKPLAVNLKTGQTQKVSKSFQFACTLCQHYSIPFSSDSFNSSGFTDSFRFIIHLTEENAKGKVTITKKLKDQLSNELNDRLQPWEHGPMKLFSSWLDENQRLNIEYRVSQPIWQSAIIGGVETSVLNGTFMMRVEDVGFCPEEDTVGVDGVVTHWPRPDMKREEELVQFVTDVTTGAITGRQCVFDPEVFHGVWTPTPTRWELAWVACTADDQYLNELDYIRFLNASDILYRHSLVLQPFTTGLVDTETLTAVASVVDREFALHNGLSKPIMRDLATITGKFAMPEDLFETSFFAVVKHYASLVVADLDGSKPVVGFTLEFKDRGIDRIAAKRERGLQEGNGVAPFAFDISESVKGTHSRVVFVIAEKDPEGLELLSRRLDDRLFEVIVMFPTKSEVSAWSLESYAKHSVEFTFELSLLLSAFDGRGNGRLGCVAWDFGGRCWSNGTCEMLNADRDGYGACRCNGKHVVLQDGVPTARFLFAQVGNTARSVNAPAHCVAVAMLVVLAWFNTAPLARVVLMYIEK